MELVKGSNQDCQYICKSLGMDKIKNDLTIMIKSDNNELIAGIIYTYVNKICYLSLYAKSPKWCSRLILSRLFLIPFIKFKDCKIVKCGTSHNNKRINKLLRGLNLREEGYIRFARDDGSHEIIFSMTEKELKNKRWFKNE